MTTFKDKNKNYHMEDKITISGYVKAETWDARYIKTYKDFLIAQNRGLLDKVRIDKTEGDNLVVTSGINQIISLVVGSTTTSFGYCGVGTGSSTVTSADVDLNTSLLRNAVSNAYGYQGQATFITFFTQSQAAGVWAESGIFTASSGGSMLCHKLFTNTFTKDSTKTASVTWQISFTAV